MPPQQGKPMKSLSARFGDRLRKAHDAAKDKEVKVNAGDLPAGIENGICQLTRCYFSEFKEGAIKGEPYLMATGIVVEPKEHAGKRVTFGPEPVCDTPERSRKTLEEHVEYIENFFKKAGADMSGIDAADAFETTAAALEEAKPFMRFRTWQGKPTPQFPDPKVNHDWGLAVDYTPGATDDVQDDTEPEPEPAPKTPAKPAAKAPPAKPAKPDLSDSDDLEALVAAANDASDEDQQAVATQRLEALAIAAGKDGDEVAGAESWEQVAEWIKEGGESAAGDETPEPDEPADPAVGDLYEYAPVDPKTKKAGKAVLCEVINVDAKKRTADLKNTVNKKLTYAGVSWDALVVPS